MKKVICILLCVVLSLSLTACGNNPSNENGGSLIPFPIYRIVLLPKYKAPFPTLQAPPIVKMRLRKATRPLLFITLQPEAQKPLQKPFPILLAQIFLRLCPKSLIQAAIWIG